VLPDGKDGVPEFGYGMYGTGVSRLFERKGCGISNEVINEMAKRGIACNVHYKPFPMMTTYKNLGFDIKDMPKPVSE